MERYAISSIARVPDSPCQWELVTQDGKVLRLRYCTGELKLCEWVPNEKGSRSDGRWVEVVSRHREGLTVLERMRDSYMALDDAIRILGDVVTVTSYVASYELTDPVSYELVATVRG